MAAPCQVCVLDQGVARCETVLDGPLELGRQKAGEPPPYQVLPASAAGPARLVLAPQQDRDNISRRHLTLTPLPDGLVRVSNHSKATVERAHADPIVAGATVDLEPPFALELPGRTLGCPSGGLFPILSIMLTS